MGAAGLHNHILWHAGHCFVLVESLVMEAIGELPQIPEGWFDIFSWHSDPAHIASYRWPTLAAGYRRTDRSANAAARDDRFAR